MKPLLWLLSVGSLVGSVATVALLVSLLRSMPGGPFIGGAGVVLALAAALVLVVLLAIGTFTAWRLGRHGVTGLLRVHLVWMGLLMVAAAVAGLSMRGRQADLQRQAERSWERSRQQAQEAAAMRADPARLAEHVARHGVDSAIAGTWMSPLEVAAEQGHTDLAVQMLGQGATVTENALVMATRRGDRALMAAMLAQVRHGPDFGHVALEAAFSMGRGDLLRLLTGAGVNPDRFLRDAIVQGQYLRFCPGDVDWRGVRDRWLGTDLPAVLRQAIDGVAGPSKVAPADFNEAQVLEVLNAVAAIEPPADADAQPARADAPPGHGPAHPAGNWQYLRDLHAPGALPAPHEGRAFALLRLLTGGRADKADDGARAILAAAVGSGDVRLVDALARQGYDLRRLEGQPAVADALASPGHAALRAELKRRGVRLAPPGDGPAGATVGRRSRPGD